MSSAPLGLRLVRLAIGAVVAFLVAAGGYLTWAALANPDVRLKQPRWFEGAFDHSYWIPVLVVTLGGAVLVGLVLWTAYRRLQAGACGERDGGQERRCSQPDHECAKRSAPSTISFSTSQVCDFSFPTPQVIFSPYTYTPPAKQA